MKAMEPKAKVRSPRAASPSKMARPPKPNPSAHMIDLRDTGAPAKRPSRRPAAVRPAPKPPKQAPKPELQLEEADYMPAPKPKPSRPEPLLLTDNTPPDKRFWPAFWRFLVLLIVL